jgi:gliding motility-associated-like protein
VSCLPPPKIPISSSGASDLFSGDVGDVTTLDLTDDLPENTEIFVLVTPYNTNGDATGCVEEGFTTINTIDVPDCTTISSPLNNESDVSISANITWNAAIGATGYTLLIGTTTGGSELFTGDVGNTLTYDPTVDFEENTTIFVTIIPYNLDGNAVGCTEEQFTTENVIDLPSCTTLSSPLNTETDVSVSASMNWNAVTNASGYRLNVGTSSGMSDIFSGDMGNVLTYTPIGNFEENATIYVTITPYNTDGDAIGCTEESFTTENIIDLPNCTILNAPTNGEQNVSVSSNISWNAATGATGFRLSIGSSPGLSDIFTGDVGNTLTYEPTSDFIDNTLVFVTVVPYNNDGAATGCTEESFSTENIINLPDCTSLSNPLADALDVPIGSSITWNNANGATGYRLSIGTSSGGTEVFTGDVGNSLSLSPNESFEENTILFVTIIPYNEDGNAIGCAEESFMTENNITVPACTMLSSPRANDMNAPLATSISWNEVENATGYNVTIGTSSGGSEIFSGDLGDVLTYVPSQDFTENTAVFVTVLPYNEDGNALGCSEERFTTETLPDLTQYGFSPNGDNVNDYWVIDGIEDSPDNTVSIYNRWGDMVFQVQGYNNGSNAFDGTANEKTKMGANELPSGTYFFNIEVSGEHNLKKLQGYLVIKR